MSEEKLVVEVPEKLMKTTTEKGFNIDCRQIVSNDRNARTFGSAPALLTKGYGVFSRPDGSDKIPLIYLARSSNAEQRQEFVGLIDSHEPRIVSMSRNILANAQLQPALARELSDKEVKHLGYPVGKKWYDVIGGATRHLAVERLRCISMMTDEEKAKYDLTPEEKALKKPLPFLIMLRTESGDDAERISHAENIDSLGTNTPLTQILTLTKAKEQIVKDATARGETITEAVVLDLLHQKMPILGVQTIKSRLAIGEGLSYEQLGDLKAGRLTLRDAEKIAKGSATGGKGPSETKNKITTKAVSFHRLCEPLPKDAAGNDAPAVKWLKEKRKFTRFRELQQMPEVQEFLSLLLWEDKFVPLAEARKAAELSETPPEDGKAVRARKSKGEETPATAEKVETPPPAPKKRGRKPKVATVPTTSVDAGVNDGTSAVPLTETPGVVVQMGADGFPDFASAGGGAE